MRSVSSTSSGPSPAIATSGAGSSRPSASQRADGVEQDVVALLRVQPADGDAPAAGPSSRPSSSRTSARVRVAGGRGGAMAGSDPDVAGAEPAGVRGEVAGDREDEVGAADGRPLGGPQHPLEGAGAL